MESVEFKNQKGQVVGEMHDSIYRKKVIREKHLMKMFGSYGIDADIFKKLVELKCKEIRVKEKDTDCIMSCSFETFANNKIMKNFDGPQFFLPSKFWTISNPNQQTLI